MTENGNNNKSRLSFITSIVAIISPIACLVWFIFNLQLNIVKADVDYLKDENTKHIEVHRQLKRDIPEKGKIEAEYTAIQKELASINQQLESCRKNDEVFWNRLYDLIRDIKK